MIAFAAATGLLLFWLVMIALVKREQGWVGISDFGRIIIRYGAYMRRLEVAVGESLTPAIRKLTRSLAALNDAWERE